MIPVFEALPRPPPGRPGKKDEGDHLIKVVQEGRDGEHGAVPRQRVGGGSFFSLSRVRISDHRKRGVMISVGKRRNL